MARNYRRAYRPEFNQSKNLHRRAAHKKTPHPKSEQPRQVQKPHEPQGRKIPAEPISNPQPTKDPILPQQGRSQGASRTMP